MTKTTEFPKGINIKNPSDKAPAFVIGKMGFNIQKMVAWLEETGRSQDEWVNLDVMRNKSGELYLSVDNFKPNAEMVPPTAKAAPNAELDVPF